MRRRRLISCVARRFDKNSAKSVPDAGELTWSVTLEKVMPQARRVLMRECSTYPVAYTVESQPWPPAVVVVALRIGGLRVCRMFYSTQLHHSRGQAC